MQNLVLKIQEIIVITKISEDKAFVEGSFVMKKKLQTKFGDLEKNRRGRGKTQK